MTTGAETISTIWKANFSECFLWAEWETEEASVFFHKGSGETLLLNPLGTFILKTLGNEEASTETLARMTSRNFNLPLDEELRGAIRMSLHTFEQKGLLLPSDS